MKLVKNRSMRETKWPIARISSLVELLSSPVMKAFVSQEESRKSFILMHEME